MVIEARRDGELFIYLNDAVLFTPGLVGWFYGGNKGKACIRVSNEPKPQEMKQGISCRDD